MKMIESRACKESHSHSNNDQSVIKFQAWNIVSRGAVPNSVRKFRLTSHCYFLIHSLHLLFNYQNKYLHHNDICY